MQIWYFRVLVNLKKQLVGSFLTQVFSLFFVNEQQGGA